MRYPLINPLTSAYTLRHLQERKLQTMMTVGGITLVVFVFVATLMLSEGLRDTLVSTGQADNALAIMAGAQNEVQSGIGREAAGVITTEPEVIQLQNGQKLASADLTVLVTLLKRSNPETSNVVLRGVSPLARELRPQIKLLRGRMFSPGTQEIVVGQAVHNKFAGTDISNQLRFVGTNWTVVGIFDGGGSAFDSEIWGDVNIMLPAFRREQFSSITFRLRQGADFSTLKKRLEKDPRLNISILKEREFYEAQSKDLSLFIEYLGGFVSIIFSLAAVIGAMITMYAAVANRFREIGILRALGFSRTLIFSAFLRECILIGIIGGTLGVALASGLSFFTFATTNFTTFADIAFGFKMTPAIALSGISFAILMSILGGLLPALKAARLSIIETLRGE